ncbi:MAG: hypothetical protein COW73_05410 [Nitrospirae bacterium CG18_big_fil_WC_8_21_14_2_50_70_55]|nr:hypothetical protein [Deltaproteobacteria bacterium]OIP64432.1 MAG: hypothetical protein AUK30_06710 [Nitrospirae bacterium CG2_30_70_394]PIQ05571.1 MAG: hypothetical protein COW73_05410 [Nitrospirae bacterium CG18_big_fil_WC_8_21_14_2_50_70_55]PIU79585.1 MAG: hypothetical protein COS73_03790 [Nitrospirae bacterium CG06_land_8_20_14_3_00_70_43]PIW82580.1 MAG: hypothetical protein COZ96_07975 [Nitrospirae bacterium CG_4_8_14_3_um_filter_70_85]PIX82503.1 MAG: hypothetical protein COZ33_10320 
MIYAGTPVIDDMVTWWRKRLENTPPAQLPVVLDHLMAERFQFNPETAKELEKLHAKFSAKVLQAA